MARQLNEIMELERENETLRDALQMAKIELHRIRVEYFDGALSLSGQAVDEVDEELETLALTIENALFG